MGSTTLNYEILKKIFTQLPKIDTQPKSILEIAGFPHYENVISNLLAFYFDPMEDHNLGDLFLKSLFIATNSIDEYSYSGDANIMREVSTKNNKRIDIVIDTENFAIAIENKIFHHAKNNPFEEYQQYLEKEYAGKHHKAFILSLRNEDKPANTIFEPLTYSVFFEALINQLGAYISNDNVFHATYVKDFVRTINNLIDTQIMKDESLEFLKNNYGEVKQINEILTEFNEKTTSKLNTMGDVLTRQLKYVKSSNIWKKTKYIEQVLYCHLQNVDNTKDFQLKVRVKPLGIQVELWYTEGLSWDNRQKLDGTFEKSKNKKPVEYIILNDSETLFDYGVDIQDIVDFVEKNLKELY